MTLLYVYVKVRVPIIHLENETRQGFFYRSAPFRDFDEQMRYGELTRMVCFNQMQRIYICL